MGRLEKQIIAGALALVGILLSVVVYRGVERSDHTLAIAPTSQWNDPGETAAETASLLKPETVFEPATAPRVDAEEGGPSVVAGGFEAVEAVDIATTIIEIVETASPLAEVINLEDADEWDSGLVEYTVKKGDMLGTIARNELGSTKLVHEILMLNEGVNPNNLQIDQVLLLPARRAVRATEVIDEVLVAATSARRIHTIVSGDTLSELARTFNVTGGVAAIVAANQQLESRDESLKLGWQLIIPE
jgi:LysM repeat protein